jgi:hypothetical protein
MDHESEPACFQSTETGLHPLYRATFRLYGTDNEKSQSEHGS